MNKKTIFTIDMYRVEGPVVTERFLPCGVSPADVARGFYRNGVEGPDFWFPPVAIGKITWKTVDVETKEQ